MEDAVNFEEGFMLHSVHRQAVADAGQSWSFEDVINENLIRMMNFQISDDTKRRF